MQNIQQTIDNKDRSLPFKLIPKTILALFGAAIAPSIVVLPIGLVGIIPVLLSGGQIQRNEDWARFMAIIVIIFMVSTLHVIVLGIPAFIAGWYFQKIRWWTSIVVAFIVGALPTAISLWPLKDPELQTTSSRWNGEEMVQTIIKGTPTLTGWTDWISAFVVMGLLGVSEGLVFWLIWRPRDTA
ncbi:MAG TPA: hypothetical protein VFQ13_22730 [Anaerolineales bacterium]|nr:hypothetical protein [Anaerolineales bacterium]